MLTYNQAFYQVQKQLQPLYDINEATAIAHIYLEFITGLNKLDRLTRKDTPFTKKQQELFDTTVKDLIKGKPVQYVTGGAWFMGREFVVTESVLIPRPETEELVQWVVDDHGGEDKEKIRIADIGAGSGCIGISLCRLLPHAIVTCVDISSEALDLLQTNAEWVLTTEERGARADHLRLLELDFLNEQVRNKELGRFDIVVSNPPYIPYKDKATLHDNVRQYEPAIALFVPDDDALVFYRAIASFGKDHLRQDGYVYCELDANHARECAALFENEGYKNVTLRKDMNGLERMLRAEKGD